MKLMLTVLIVCYRITWSKKWPWVPQFGKRRTTCRFIKRVSLNYKGYHSVNLWVVYLFILNYMLMKKKFHVTLNLNYIHTCRCFSPLFTDSIGSATFLIAILWNCMFWIPFLDVLVNVKILTKQWYVLGVCLRMNELIIVFDLCWMWRIVIMFICVGQSTSTVVSLC